jgi:hypothetical protein
MRKPATNQAPALLFVLAAALRAITSAAVKGR